MRTERIRVIRAVIRVIRQFLLWPPRIELQAREWRNAREQGLTHTRRSNSARDR